MAHEATDMLEGRVTWKRRLALWWHLVICEHCRRFVRHLKILRRFNSQRAVPPADPATVKQILERVSRESGE